MAAKMRDKKTMVSASELSQMGACERLVLFEAKYGKRMSRCQQEAIERGRREHAKFFRDGVRSQSDVQTSLSKPVVLLRVARMGSRSTRDGPTEKVPRPDPAKNGSRSVPDPGLLQNGARALQTRRGAQEAHPCVVPGIKAGIVDRQGSAGDSG